MFAGVAPALAQDKPVEMRFAHWLPPQNPLVVLGFTPWAKSVEAASKGSIKVTFYPAQQLGKAADHYDMARDGIADMTWVAPGLQAGRFPVFAASELPFLFDKPGPSSAALDAWYRKYAATEMRDIKYCFAQLYVGTLHSKKPIIEPADLKGVKVRPPNGTSAQMVTLLGGTNVQLAAPEARDAIERGVADAIMFPWESLRMFNIDKSVKYHLDARMFAGTQMWAINKTWYERLSPKQKKVIDDHCNNEWAEKVGAAWGGDEDAGQAKIEKTPGHKITKLTPQQVDAWKKAVEPVTAQWMQTVGKTGLNPQQVLDELRKELAARNAGY